MCKKYNLLFLLILLGASQFSWGQVQGMDFSKDLQYEIVVGLNGATVRPGQISGDLGPYRLHGRPGVHVSGAMLQELENISLYASVGYTSSGAVLVLPIEEGIPGGRVSRVWSGIGTEMALGVERKLWQNEQKTLGLGLHGVYAVAVSVLHFGAPIDGWGISTGSNGFSYTNSYRGGAHMGYLRPSLSWVKQKKRIAYVWRLAYQMGLWNNFQLDYEYLRGTDPITGLPYDVSFSYQSRQSFVSLNFGVRF